MRVIIVSVATLAVLVAMLVLYIIVMNAVLPRVFMKMRSDIAQHLGRGLKKYTYPSGRGIVYEPHPSVRKYVKKYALFTNDGYKYLQCRTGKDVSKISYSVVMMDRHDAVIDVLDVNENPETKKKTAPLLLHQDTSYVALEIKSVNGYGIRNRGMFYYSLPLVVAYFIVTTLVSFATVTFGAMMFESAIRGLLGVKYILYSESAIYFWFSLGIGAFSLLLMLLRGRRKGIGVRLK